MPYKRYDVASDREADLLNQIDKLTEAYEADIKDLESKLDGFVQEVKEAVSALDGIDDVIKGAIEDLRTLGEVPMNLIDAAIENIIDDLKEIV